MMEVDMMGRNDHETYILLVSVHSSDC